MYNPFSVFGNFYRRFIQGFANIYGTTPLLDRKDTTWHWDNDLQNSIHTPNKRFTSAPILLCQISRKQFRLRRNASDYDYGAILSQQSDMVMAFRLPNMSKQMLPAERNTSSMIKTPRYHRSTKNMRTIWKEVHILSKFGPITRTFDIFVRRNPLTAAKPMELIPLPFSIHYFPSCRALNKADHLTREVRSFRRGWNLIIRTPRSYIHQFFESMPLDDDHQPQKRPYEMPSKNQRRNDLLANSVLRHQR